MEKQKYLDKIAKLEARINDASGAAEKLEKCIPTTTIIGGVLPVVFALALYLWNPAFLQKKDGEGTTRDKFKLFLAIVGLSIASWGGLYVFSKYSGEVCSRP